MCIDCKNILTIAARMGRGMKKNLCYIFKKTSFCFFLPFLWSDLIGTDGTARLEKGGENLKFA